MLWESLAVWAGERALAWLQRQAGDLLTAPLDQLRQQLWDEPRARRLLLQTLTRHLPPCLEQQLAATQPHLVPVVRQWLDPQRGLGLVPEALHEALQNLAALGPDDLTPYLERALSGWQLDAADRAAVLDALRACLLRLPPQAGLDPVLLTLHLLHWHDRRTEAALQQVLQRLERFFAVYDPQTLGVHISGPLGHFVQQDFWPLTPGMMAAARRLPPQPFYDGAEPNWANIALDYDAPRTGWLRQVNAWLDDPEPPRKAMILLAPAGQGKTTALMRLAWNRARAGDPVLVHREMLSDPPTDLHAWSVPQTRPFIFIVDRADQHVDMLRRFHREWQNRPAYRLVLAARPHEWSLVQPAARSLGLNAEIPFPDLADPAQEDELRAMLARLAQHDALGLLRGVPAEQRVQRFRQMLRSQTVTHGQLLAAMLVVRHDPQGRRGFLSLVEKRLLDFLDAVLDRGRRPTEEVRTWLALYILTALVHRWDRWLHHQVLLQALEGMPLYAQPGVVLRQARVWLQREFLLQQEVASSPRWRTRHPVLAWATLVLLYPDDFHAGPAAEAPRAAAQRLDRENLRPWATLADAHRALWQALAAFPADQARELGLHRLLTSLAVHLSLEARGRVDPGLPWLWRATQAASAAREVLPVAQGWGLRFPVLYQALGVLEKEAEDLQRARAVLTRGLRRVRSRRGRALLLSTRGSLQARGWKDYAAAEEDFRRALELNPYDPHTHYHLARDVLLPQGRRDEACRHLQRALQLRVRKRGFRRHLQRFYRRWCKG